MAEAGKAAGLRAGEPFSGYASDPRHGTPNVAGDGPQNRDPDEVVRRRGTLAPQTRDRIAAQLRVLYDSVALQPVPDRFADLIARLDDSDRKSR